MMNSTAKNLEIAGFVIADEAAIWGLGVTEDAAWLHFRRGMSIAKVPHKSEVDIEDAHCPPYWSEEKFKVTTATAALLADVEKRGGNIAWNIVDGVACTPNEFEAATGEEPVMLTRQSEPDGPRFIAFFMITGEPLVVRATAEDARKVAVEWGHLDDDAFVEVLDISTCPISTRDFIYRYKLFECRHYPTVWRGDGYGAPIPPNGLAP